MKEMEIIIFCLLFAPFKNVCSFTLCIFLSYPNSTNTHPCPLEKHALNIHKGLPMWRSGKESACQCRRCGLDLWVGKIHWSRKWKLTPVFLPGKFHGQSSLVGYSLWGHKESDMTDWARNIYHRDFPQGLC